MTRSNKIFLVSRKCLCVCLSGTKIFSRVYKPGMRHGENVARVQFIVSDVPQGPYVDMYCQRISASQWPNMKPMKSGPWGTGS
jgi:hypothetical protein